MDKIIIEKAPFLTKIGVSEEERAQLQEILIDIVIYYNIKKAAESDDIRNSINYSEIYSKIKPIAEQQCKLIETMAEKIAELILCNYHIEKIKVRVKKPRRDKTNKYEAAVEIVRKR